MDKVFDIPVQSMTLLKGGANNRVHLLNDTYIVKEYFQHPNDPRQRLDTEYNFLSFAWEQGLRQIPKPLRRDESKALYTKVPGTLVETSSDPIVLQALSFYLELNQHHQKGRHLPNASESAMIALQSIENRLQKIHSVLPDFALHLKALLPSNPTSCDQEDLRLSPSDFGMHNILFDGTTAYFLDFEYAGWDDPAKTVCDFFTSPRIPIPKNHFWTFAHTVAKTLQNPKAFYERLHFHFSLSQIKWCCVILNVFLKTDEERRIFAKSDYSLDTQLQKARHYMAQFSKELPSGIR